MSANCHSAPFPVPITCDGKGCRVSTRSHERAAFSSLKAGEAFINLVSSRGYEHRWWGRVIFRVDHLDAQYRALEAQGLMLESPRDAAWGERYFHITDPDGHELSFAEQLPVGG